MPRQKKEKPTLVEDDEENVEYAIIPPDGGWGWVVVIAALYLNTVIDGVFYTFSVFLQDLADHFETDKSKISLIFSILFGTHYGMGVVSAGLSNAFGLRKVTCAGAILAGCAFALSSIVPNYPLLYFTYGLLGGIGLGLMITNGVIAPTIYFSRWRGLAIAITSMGTGIGAVVFPYVGNHIRKIASWQTAFQFQAIGIASIFFAGLTFRPIKPTRIITTEDMEMNITEKRRSKVLSDKSSRSFGLPSEPAPLRVPTVYFKKALYDRGMKSTMSFNMPTQVAESLGAQVTYSRFTRRGPRCCCDACFRTNRKRESTESVLAVHPGAKTELFLEDSPMKIKSTMNADFRKSRFISAMSLQPSAFVYSKMEPPRSKRNMCEPLTNSVKSMLDCKVLRSPSYVIFVVTGVMSLIGLVVVTAYQPDRAVLQGFDDDTATYFVMTFGAANSLWRLFLGVISVLPKSNNVAASVGCTVVGGLASLVSASNLSLWFQYMWAIGAGLALASFAVHRPVIMVDLVGLDRITPATGIQYMLMGVGAILGPPLSGLVMESSNNIDAPFYISGSLIVASGFLMTIVGYVHRKEHKNDEEADFPSSLQ